MSTKSDDLNRSRNSAGLAGAGGGTLVAVIANELPDTTVLKVPLIYCAPSISLLLTLVWVWLQVRVVSYFREREVKTLVKKLREKLQRQIQDPSLSTERRAYLQEKINDLELVHIERLEERLKSLNVITVENFSSSLRSKGPDSKVD